MASLIDSALASRIEKLVDDLYQKVVAEIGKTHPIHQGQQGQQGAPRVAPQGGHATPQGGTMPQMPASSGPVGNPNRPNVLFPKWKGLRGLFRYLWKGNSPDNPDYAATQGQDQPQREWLSLAEYNALAYHVGMAVDDLELEFRSYYDPSLNEDILPSLKPYFDDFKKELTRTVVQHARIQMNKSIADGGSGSLPKNLELPAKTAKAASAPVTKTPAGDPAPADPSVTPPTAAEPEPEPIAPLKLDSDDIVPSDWIGLSTAIRGLSDDATRKKMALRVDKAKENQDQAVKRSTFNAISKELGKLGASAPAAPAPSTDAAAGAEAAKPASASDYTYNGKPIKVKKGRGRHPKYSDTVLTDPAEIDKALDLVGRVVTNDDGSHDFHSRIGIVKGVKAAPTAAAPTAAAPTAAAPTAAAPTAAAPTAAAPTAAAPTSQSTTDPSGRKTPIGWGHLKTQVAGLPESDDKERIKKALQAAAATASVGGLRYKNIENQINTLLNKAGTAAEPAAPNAAAEPAAPNAAAEPAAPSEPSAAAEKPVAATVDDTAGSSLQSSVASKVAEVDGHQDKTITDLSKGIKAAYSRIKQMDDGKQKEERLKDLDAIFNTSIARGKRLANLFSSLDRLKVPASTDPVEEPASSSATADAETDATAAPDAASVAAPADIDDRVSVAAATEPPKAFAGSAGLAGRIKGRSAKAADAGSTVSADDGNVATMEPPKEFAGSVGLRDRVHRRGAEIVAARPAVDKLKKFKFVIDDLANKSNAAAEDNPDLAGQGDALMKLYQRVANSGTDKIDGNVDKILDMLHQQGHLQSADLEANYADVADRIAKDAEIVQQRKRDADDSGIQNVKVRQGFSRPQARGAILSPMDAPPEEEESDDEGPLPAVFQYNNADLQNPDRVSKIRAAIPSIESTFGDSPRRDNEIEQQIHSVPGLAGLYKRYLSVDDKDATSVKREIDKLIKQSNDEKYKMLINDILSV